MGIVDGINYDIKYSKIKNIYIQVKDKKVIVKAPKKVSKKYIEELIHNKSNWINKKLSEVDKRKLYTDNDFKSLVDKYITEISNITGLYPNKVRIKVIQYAWGTCSSKKNITINYNLIKYSKEVIRYVILHEICHLKYMNHSKDFWDLVEKYMPEYKKIKKELKS